MSKINIRSIFCSLLLLVILSFGLVIPRGITAQLSLSSQKSSLGTDVAITKNIEVSPIRPISPVITPAPVATHVEGTFLIIHEDNFDQKTSTDVPFLRTDDGRLIRLDADANVTSEFSIGSFVGVDGTIPQGSVNRVAVPYRGMRPIRPVMKTTSSIVVHKTAVILFNFTDDNSTPSTPSYIRQGIFGPGISVNGYYDEVSFHKIAFQGKLNVAGDVFGWYTIPFSKQNCRDNYDPTWTPAARTAAQKDGFNFDNYDNVIYIFPRTDCSDHGVGNFSGAGEPGGKQSWINGANFTNIFGVIAHELGHNMGLSHSGAVKCVDPGTGKRMVVTGNCLFNESPGNYFDVMGPGILYHLNAFQKSVMGFISPQNIQTVTTDGTYTLAPLEFTVKGNAQVLRIPMTYCSFCANYAGLSVAYYYLEYRRSSTYDNWDSWQFPAFGKGIMINLGPDYTFHGRSILLQPNPDLKVDPNSDGYVLTANQSFQDDANKIKITTLTAGGPVATVKIEFLK